MLMLPIPILLSPSYKTHHQSKNCLAVFNVPLDGILFKPTHKFSDGVRSLYYGMS